MSSGILNCSPNWNANFVRLSLGWLLLVIWNLAEVIAAPLPLVQVPIRCDIVVIKSVESNAYLGVSLPYTNQSTLKAIYGYSDPEARFEFNLFGLPSDPALLTVKIGTDLTDRRRLLLGFDGTQGVMKSYTFGNYQLNKQPNNTLLMLGGWPVTNHTVSNSTILKAGPYYRFYLRNDTNVKEARGVIGVNRAGQVVLYPMDNADAPNNQFVNPSTLFFIDVVSRPGGNSCARVTS